MIVIATPTGNIGKRVKQECLTADEPIWVIARVRGDLERIAKRKLRPKTLLSALTLPPARASSKLLSSLT